MMRIKLLIIFILLASSAWAQIPSTLGWYDIPNSKIRPNCPNEPTIQEIGGCPAVTTAWNSGVMDTLRNRLIIWGGGHNDYAGNELYAVNVNTLTTTRITYPGLPPSTDCGESIVGGTQPNSRHTYDGISYMANVDRMFVFGGSKAPCGNASNGTWLFNFATNLWEPKSPAGPIPRFDYGIVTAYDPNTGKVFLHDNNDLYSYDYSTNAYTKLNSGSGGIDYHMTAAIDPVFKRLVIIGGGQGWWYDIAPGSIYVKQTLSQTGSGGLCGTTSPGLDWDSISNRLIGWNGGTSVYSFDWQSSQWTAQTFSNPPAVASGNNGTIGRFSFSPASGVFIFYGNIDSDAYSLRFDTPITYLTSFQLSSTNTGTFPFTIGLGFKKGDIPNNPILDIPDQQVIVKRRWNDGSVKHAIASGQVAITSGLAKSINVANSSSSVPAGLTSADITAAAPSASVQLGAIGTVNLSTLLSSPFRTWITGPEMVECHYRSNVGSDATLSVWFHVRLYKAGRIWVRAVVENGYLNVSTDNGHSYPNISKSYIPTVTIGGVIVYSNGGATLTHYGFSRWSAEGWIGGNPAVLPKHNIQYLIDTKLVPNYWKRSPSTAALNALHQTYLQMSNADLSQSMGDPGFQNQIGLLPLWDALYVTSTDSRAYNSVLANSSSMNSYPIIWRDSNTQLPAKPSNWPSFAIDDGTFEIAAGANRWNWPHEPSEGYLAYLITGDYWHYETCLFHAAMNYLARSPSAGTGLNRILWSETRGTAWALRTNSQLAAICPTGDVVCADYQTLLANNVAYWNTTAAGITPPGIGDVFEYGFGYPGGAGVIAPWQQHFWDQSVGMGSDIEPLANMTAWNQHRDYVYKFCVGILGDQTGFYFTWASDYNIQISNSNATNPTTFYTTWAQCWAGSLALGFVQAIYDNTLKGVGGSGDPALAATGYWGNLIPAIAYAVDHGTPGAAAAWTRMTGTTNWSIVANSGFDDIPIWGVIPRGTVAVPTPLPPTNLRVIGN